MKQSCRNTLRASQKPGGSQLRAALAAAVRSRAARNQNGTFTVHDSDSKGCIKSPCSKGPRSCRIPDLNSLDLQNSSPACGLPQCTNAFLDLDLEYKQLAADCRQQKLSSILSIFYYRKVVLHNAHRSIFQHWARFAEYRIGKQRRLADAKQVCYGMHFGVWLSFKRKRKFVGRVKRFCSWISEQHAFLEMSRAIVVWRCWVCKRQQPDHGESMERDLRPSLQSDRNGRHCPDPIFSELSLKTDQMCNTLEDQLSSSVLFLENFYQKIQRWKDKNTLCENFNDRCDILIL